MASNPPLRVLVAGTADAIGTVQEALEHDTVQLVAAYSVREALAYCGREPFDVIACSVRFDESRMFEFLQALTQREPPCAARIIAFRATGGALTTSTRTAIRQALEALGVERFVDLHQTRYHYGEAVARETLRKMVLDERFVPPAPRSE